MPHKIIHWIITEGLEFFWKSTEDLGSLEKHMFQGVH